MLVTYNLKKQGITNLFIVGIYISITYMWNLISFDLIDVVFIIIMLYFILEILKKPIKYPVVIKKDIIFLLIFVSFAIFQTVYALLKVEQTVFETFLTTRELFYICVAFVFGLCTVYKERSIKLIINLELIGIFLYTITFFIGKPLSPFANFLGNEFSVGGVSIYRDFTSVPLLPTFLCPYLFWGIFNKKYLWNFKRDLVSAGMIFLGLALHLFRTKLFLLVAGVALIAIISVEKRKRALLLKRIAVALIVVTVTVTIAMSFSVVRNRFLEGIFDISYALSGQELNPYNGTFTYRIWLLNYRVEYLVENHKLLFGMGAISSRNETMFFGGGNLQGNLAMMYNPDNAYLTLLARYGVVGTGFYVGSLLVFMINFFKQKTRLSLATGIFILCCIIEGISGNSALCEYALILIGMLIGLCISEKAKISGKKV